jgi:hypothetical protein
MTAISRRATCPRSVLQDCAIVAALGCLFTASAALAQAPSASAVDAANVEPFVSETTILIVKVDADRIDLPDLDQATKAMSPDAGVATRQALTVLRASVERLRSLAGDHPVYATVGLPISPSRWPVFVFARGLSPSQAAQVTESMQQAFKTKTFTHDDYLIASPVNRPDTADPLADFPAVPREGIQDAFQSVQGYPVQILLIPPAYARRTIQELSPELPPQLGGGPSRVLTEGVGWAALGVDPQQLRGTLVLQSSSDTAAADLADHLPKMLRAAYEAASPIHEQIPDELFQALLAWLEPRVDGDRVTLQLDGLEKTSANLRLLAAVARTLEDKVRRHTNADRFKQIVLAIHNYHDTYKSFPPTDEHRNVDGRPALSWRVHLLPFLGQSELYRQFHLDEPWDSEHNRQFLEKMPDVYASYSLGVSPSAALKPGYTTFLAPVGKDTVFGGMKATTYGRITDGTSNTVVLVEVKPDKAVPWTAPEDYAFDPDTPAAGLQIGADGRWLCAYADGSVHQLLGDLPPETFLHLFQINDGHVIDHKRIH